MDQAGGGIDHRASACGAVCNDDNTCTYDDNYHNNDDRPYYDKAAHLTLRRAGFRPLTLAPYAGGQESHRDNHCCFVPGSAGRTAIAIDVNGSTSDNDEACAIAGIEAAGLKANPGDGAPLRGK